MGSQTYRLTLGASRPFVSLQLICATPDADAGEIVSLDAQATGQGAAPDSNPVSGVFSPAGSDLFVVGGYGEHSGQTFSAPLINGVAADGSYISAGDPNFTALWYKILAAPFSNGTASGTLGGSADWICNAIAFKSEVAGGGGGQPAAARIAKPAFGVAPWSVRRM